MSFLWLGSPATPSRAEASPKATLAQDEAADRGRALFGLYCSTCHAKAGAPSAFGAIGPDLTGFESQPLIASVAPNTAENLARWLANPQAVKRDAAMPPLGLSAAQISDIVAYLLPPQDPLVPTVEAPAEEQ
jgi:cytochrome c oxidase subunit 2